MTYAVIYYENGERKWKKATDIEAAEAYGKEHTDVNDDYDVYVSLYEYDKLKHQIEIMKKRFKQIEEICKDE